MEKNIIRMVFLNMLLLNIIFLKTEPKIKSDDVIPETNPEHNYMELFNEINNDNNDNSSKKNSKRKHNQLHLNNNKLVKTEKKKINKNNSDSDERSNQIKS